MTRSIQLDIPVLLPGVQDDQDACVARVVSLLEGRDGIEEIHVRHDEVGRQTEHPVGKHPADEPPAAGELCLHFDPERISIAQITDLATRAGATVSRRFAHELIPFRSIAAEDEGLAIEEALRSLPGVTAATVNYAGQVARVEYDRERVSRDEVLARLADAGAPLTEVVRAPSTGEQPERPSWYARNRELAWSLTAGVLTVAGWLISRTHAPPLLAIAVFVAAYAFGSRDNLGHLLRDIQRGRFHFNIDLLMVVAAIGAAILGAWAEGALLLFLFSLGHALEHYALGRARNAIKALADLAPQTATIRKGGISSTIAISEVRLGDQAVVRPSERISVDGVVVEGRSAVNQAPITGESVPVEKTVGDGVFAGTVNGDGVLIVEVSAAVGDRTLDRVITLVAEAGTNKAATQQFTERFERAFVPIVLVADLLLIIGPPVLGLWSWAESFYRAMALLVAASPCALALGTPATVLAGIAQAARNGVLIKGGAHLEALGSIDVFALDKTGTITRGEPEVTDVAPMPGVAKETVLATAAGVESHSQHPLARAVIDAAVAQKLSVMAANDVQSVTGAGVRGILDGATIEVGRLSMFDGANGRPPSIVTDTVEGLESSGRTTMVVRRVGGVPEWLGVIGVADQPRVNIRETLDALRASGVRRIVMLTGDNASVARAVAQAVGIDDVRAGLMPEDKVTAIKELGARGAVAMVGDGVNDAPALAHATVGIAMGGAGTAAALETADVALMADDLSRLPFAVGLSRQARSIIRQNLVISLAVIGILAVATIAGFARIGPAVVVHEGSTLVVIANALRLLRFQSPGLGGVRK